MNTCQSRFIVRDSLTGIMDDADVGVVAHRLPRQVDEAVEAAAGKPGVNEIPILKRFDNVLKNSLFLPFLV